jgi:hypothetical protein
LHHVQRQQTAERFPHLLQVMSMLPLLQQSGKTGPGAPILFAFWALSAPIFGSQAWIA